MARCDHWVDFGPSYGRVTCTQEVDANGEHPGPHWGTTTPARQSHRPVQVTVTWEV